MDIAGARTRAARFVSALRPRRAHTAVAMRDLAGDLSAALRSGPRPRPVSTRCAGRCARG